MAGSSLEPPAVATGRDLDRLASELRAEHAELRAQLQRELRQQGLVVALTASAVVACVVVTTIELLAG